MLPRFLVLLAALIFVFGGCKDEEVADDDISSQNDDDTTAADDDTTEEPAVDVFRGMWASMEIASDGEVLVAYYDYLEGALGLAHLGPSSTEFTHEQVDGFTYTTDTGLPVNPGDRGRYLDMALDASDTPHISYHDKDETSLMYTTWDGSQWTNETVDGTSGSASVGTFTSIALDASGNPGIAYYDAGDASLRFATKDVGWTTEIVDEGELLDDAVAAEITEPDVGPYTHMVVEDGTWWIAYYDRANSNLKLAHGTPGAWTLETVAGNGDGDKGAWPFLYAEGAGVFRVAFQDVGEQDLLVGRYEAAVLTAEVVDAGDFVGADSVIEIVGGGVRVHYFDGLDNDVKQAVDLGDGTWEVSTLISDGAVGFSNNLAFHSGNMVTCSFNYTTGDLHYEVLAP